MGPVDYLFAFVSILTLTIATKIESGENKAIDFLLEMMAASCAVVVISRNWAEFGPVMVLAIGPAVPALVRIIPWLFGRWMHWRRARRQRRAAA